MKDEVANEDLLRESEDGENFVQFLQEVDGCPTSISYSSKSHLSPIGRQLRWGKRLAEQLAQFLSPFGVLLNKRLDKRRVGHVPADRASDHHVWGPGQGLAALGVGRLSPQSGPGSGRDEPAEQSAAFAQMGKLDQ